MPSYQQQLLWDEWMKNGENATEVKKIDGFFAFKDGAIIVTGEPYVHYSVDKR